MHLHFHNLNIMNRLVLTLLGTSLLLLLAPDKILAVPAAPILHTLSQSDGSTITARRWGDENSSGWETPEGYTILFDTVLKEWVYAIPDQHREPVSSGRIVGRHERAAAAKQFRPHRQGEPGTRLKSITPRKNLRSSRSSSLPAAASSPGPSLSPPIVAVGNIPVILINFNNTTATYTPANFESLLFGTGTSSMKDYFNEVSYGIFSVSSGPTGIIGWLTAANIHNYYGQDAGGTSGNDAWPGDLVYEAVQQADATVNFAPYDQDGDCSVDAVAIIHQGTGQEASGANTDIWSHSWSLSDAKIWGNSHYGVFTTNDPCTTDPGRFVTIDNYVIQPEKLFGGISTMGVFAHEYGHALGLPDLYDTDGSSQGVGDWSLMASGSWNMVTQYGDRPAHLDPWSKYFLNWISPTQLTATTSAKTFTSVEGGSDFYQFLEGSPQSGSSQYFLLENRQKTGFDAGLPGDGLLLWHIDEQIADNDSEWYPGCDTCTSHYRVALMQADNLYDLENNVNRGDGGDSYPGSTANRAIGSTTAPANSLYGGNDSGFGIACISPSAPTMTADIYLGAIPTYTLNIDLPGTGSGIVTSTPAGISCGSSCSSSFPVCTPVTLAATVSTSGTIFTGWSGGGCSGTGSCTLELTSDQTISATFTPAETFSSLFLPLGWSVVDNAGTGAVWSFVNPLGRANYTGGSGNFAIIDSVKYGTVAVDTELRSPVFNMADKNIVTLSFKTDFSFKSTNASHEIADVDLSTDGASGPWRNLWRKTANYRGPHTETLDISVPAGGKDSVIIRFHYYNANNDRWWEVDEVTVTGKDTIPPDTVITSGQATPTTATTAPFIFSSPDPTATFTCSLDNGTWSTCSSPATYSNLALGNHTFTVRASDPSGNTDPTPATWNWSIIPPKNLQLSIAENADSYFPTFGAALATLPAGALTTIKALGLTFSETIDLNSCTSEVTIAGGYASDFTTISGQTTINGQVAVSCGLLIVANLIIY